MLSATVEQAGRAITELIEKGICDAQIGNMRISATKRALSRDEVKMLHVTLDNSDVTCVVTLINRRMERERKEKEGNKKRQENFRERKKSNGGSNGAVTGDISLSLSSSPLSVNSSELTSSPGEPVEDDISKYRKTLKEKKAWQERFRRGVIEPLRDEMQDISWKMFIEPLLVANVTETEIVLWVESSGLAIWIGDNYLEKIQAKITQPGMEVRITSEVPE